MTRLLLSAILATLSVVAFGQTRLFITNVTLTEGSDVRRGADVTVSLNRAQGGKPVVIFADQRYVVDGRFKVKTHNVRRTSAKQGAVYLTMYMTMKVDGRRNKRTVQKTFYAEQDRGTTFTESFTVKVGINVRKITVSFEGRIE